MSSSNGFHDPFREHHKFQDDIWGRILLSDMERDVIDTPEFQRLFRTSQLGFVDLVYQTANHTRGAHSIGACHVATLLLNSLKENRESTKSAHQADIQITAAERVLIRLGALLHDVSHVPLSHDIERKKHHIEFSGGKKIKMPSHYGQYDKHDDFVRNPLLFVLLFDTDTSVLARLLRFYSKPFYSLLRSSEDHTHAATSGADAANGTLPQERKTHVSTFVSLLCGCEGTDWDPNVLLLPSLLFHLLTVESPEEDGMHRSFDVLTSFHAKPTSWGLGPPASWNEFHNAWYQPFRHDIIGNTLSADLIDYLRRDPQRLGMDRRIELYILNYYILVHDEKLTATFRSSPDAQADKKLYRCAIDVIDDKRGTSRTVLLNDLFRLLDLRHEIHEKAVMHRVVQGAIAMLSRALLILTDKNAKPSLPDILALNSGHHALQGEESFFHSLLAKSKAQPDRQAAYAILSKLVDRRIYRPLMIIPGDRAAKRFPIKEANTPLTETEFSLRTLAALVDSTYYSRFLLFVSAMMEKLLQGVFENDNEVCQYVTDHVVESDSDLDQLMNLIPSRVIAWTTPFKQLYKDPAIMVALKDGIIRLDELAKDGGQGEPDCTTIRSLVTESIKQADAKYAAMWKLYVFVSDSLFYTGILSKLTVPALPRLNAKQRQQELLENAQTFFVRAFDVMFDNWKKRLEDGLSPDHGGAVLSSGMDSGAFRTLAGRWISQYQSNDKEKAKLAGESWDPSFGLSTVNLDRYVHGWDAEAGRPEANCRDIQYKADKTSEGQLRIARENAASAQGRLVKLLQQCGVTTVEELSEKEFIGLLGLFEKNEAKCKSLREAGAGTNRVLRALWADELPGLFTPSRDAPTPRFELRDRERIKTWFVEEIRVCEAPHVRRALLGSTDAFVELIESTAEPKRNDLASAIRRRVINEAGFIFNRLKEDEVERWLDSQRRLLAGEAADDGE